MSISSRSTQLFLAYFLAYFCATGNPIVVTNLPFIMEEFQISPIETSLVISVYALPGAIIIPFYGVLSDRFGRKPVLVACFLLCLLGSAIAYASPSFFWLLLGRVFQGISLTPLEAMGNTLASDLFEGEARMKCIAHCTSLQYLSILVTPLVVMALMLRGGWRMGFIFTGALSILALLVCLPAQISYTPSKSVSLREYGRHLRQILTSFRVLSLFTVRLSGALIIFGAIYPYFALLLTSRIGVPAERTNIAYLGYGAGMFLGALFTPLAARRLSSRMFGIVGGLQVCLSAVLLLMAGSLWHVFIALLLAGTGCGMINASCAGHVSLAASPDTRGSTMSVYSTVFRFGQAIGPVLFGITFQMGNFEGLFGANLAVSLFLLFMTAYSFSYANRMEHRQLRN